eukprot:43330-Chlamydomonas_euryale.AAC.3
MSARCPTREKRCLSTSAGPPPPKGGVAQPLAKHDQAKITTLFTRTPVPGKLPGTPQQQEDRCRSLPQACRTGSIRRCTASPFSFRLTAAACTP